MQPEWAQRISSLVAIATVCSDTNGAKETRTPDPLRATQVLYQLSYGPI